MARKRTPRAHSLRRSAGPASLSLSLSCHSKRRQQVQAVEQLNQHWNFGVAAVRRKSNGCAEKKAAAAAGGGAARVCLAKISNHNACIWPQPLQVTRS
jgi:hypothetical protein